MAKYPPNLHSIKNHPFRKKWGQNFLRDANIINKIINTIQPQSVDVVFEIGCGDGALTHNLLQLCQKVHAVEIDPLLIELLKAEKYSNLTLYHGDILKFDFSILPEKIKIIGNLPYYISSPILFMLLELNCWTHLSLMVQKEVGLRITAEPGSKDFGRLSVMCQVYSKPSLEFTVPQNVFQPKPKVDSAVISFQPVNYDNPNFKLFSAFIKQSFSQRRKKLKNNLPELNKSDILGDLAHKRPEELSVENFVSIFRQIKF